MNKTDENYKSIILDFKSFQTLALNRHNELRSAHENTPPLVLDADLCKQAQVSYFIIMTVIHMVQFYFFLRNMRSTWLILE